MINKLLAVFTVLTLSWVLYLFASMAIDLLFDGDLVFAIVGGITLIAIVGFVTDGIQLLISEYKRK